VWCYGPEFVAKDLRKWLADIGFAARFILEQIGVAVETTEDTYLDQILTRFAPLVRPRSGAT